ncbi:hypothetical protein BV22DRAFT_1035591 [Leucogyrophana mollusca]|uniref:Uncharacterized protein n=1 Tax=Leucogyrophana mollusca TaxID=85980 RepID=A0ACB8BFM0_9AGAM|nr:hypothetical protein BV22DRAFT_1035591 [Leucogyrophana mollusca]
MASREDSFQPREEEESGDEQPAPELFVKDGQSVVFFFHPSIRAGRDRLTEDIIRNGGTVCDTDREADVVLADDTECNIKKLVLSYGCSRQRWKLSVHVEPRNFIQRCIRTQHYAHRPQNRQGMPGAPRSEGGRRARQPFTKEDDDNLCYYIATRIPDRSDGGRAGNQLYQDLMDLPDADPEEYAWVNRHTWHSWRERYQKKSSILDPIIIKKVAELDGVGLRLAVDPRSRRHGRGGRTRRRSLEEETEEEEEGVSGGEAAVRREPREDGEGHIHDPLLSDVEEEDERALGEGKVASAQARVRPQKRRRDRSDAHDGYESPLKKRRMAKRAAVEKQGKRVLDVENRRRAGTPTRGGKRETDSVGIDESDPAVNKDVEDEPLFGEYQYDDVARPPSPDIEIDRDDAPGPSATQRTLVEPGSPPGPSGDMAQGSRGKDTVARTRSLKQRPESRAHPGPSDRRKPPPSSQATVVPTQVQGPRVSVPLESGGHGAGEVSNVAHQTEAQTIEPAVPVAEVKSTVAARKNSRAQPSAKPQPAEAPFRNTRARSRSVEPKLATVSHPKSSKGKGKPIKKELDDVPESDHELKVEEERDGQGFRRRGRISSPSSHRLPMAETLEDEMAVENILDEPSAFAHESDTLPTHQSQEFQLDSDADEQASDSDDAETHQFLHPTRPDESDSESTSGSEPHLDDDDEDDEVDLDGITEAGFRQGSTRITSTMNYPTDVTVDTLLSPRQTRRQRAAQASLASTSRRPVMNFPSPNTKAREYLDRKERDTRRAPYSPPKGSRAAAHLQGRGA